MAEAWKHLDLEGQGLQTANLELIKLMKKRSAAYGRLLFFPLGLHRTYLEDTRGAWLYRLVTLAVIGLAFLPHPYAYASLALAAALAAFALYDIRWIEDRVAALNKKLRMQVYFKQGAAAPKGYRGRYTDDGLEDYLKTKEQERAGHIPVGTSTASGPGPRAPSFAEQEAMLKELAKSKKQNP